MFRRTANRVDELPFDVEKETEGNHQFGHEFSEVMQWVWSNMGEGVVKNSQKMVERQHPVKILQFKVYKKDDYFFHKRIAKRFYKDALDETIYKLNAKLQHRWTGPYRIVEQLNEVLYKADIHGVIKVVHAINMRPY